jgi:hypothetical protein
MPAVLDADGRFGAAIYTHANYTLNIHLPWGDFAALGQHYVMGEPLISGAISRDWFANTSVVREHEMLLTAKRLCNSSIPRRLTIEPLSSSSHGWPQPITDVCPIIIIMCSCIEASPSCALARSMP